MGEAQERFYRGLLLLVVFALPSETLFGADEDKISSDEALREIILLFEKPSKKAISQELLASELKAASLMGLASDEITFPEGSDLEKAIRKRLGEEAGQTIKTKDIAKAMLADKSLSKEQMNELAALLRVKNIKRVKDLGRETDTSLLKKMAESELAAIIKSGEGKLSIPKKIREKLISKFREAFPDEKNEDETPLSDKEVLKRLKTPAFLGKLMGELKEDSLTEAEWLSLAGNLRNDSRRIGNDSFVNRARDEMGEALAKFRAIQDALRAADPIRQGEVIRPFNPNFGNPSGKRASIPNTLRNNQSFPPQSAFKHNPGGSGRSSRGSRGSVNPGTGNIFNGRIQAQDPRGGNAISIDGGIASRAVLDSQDEDRLNRQRQAGHVSVRMATTYPSSPPGSVSSCQTTATSKEEIPGGLCEYDFATALHCVQNERGEVANGLQIAGLNIVALTRLDADQFGKGDLAMMTVQANCADIPVVPLAGVQPKSGEAIMVYGRAPLKGVATDQVSGNSLLMMNVRHPDNDGLGIYQGDSGGAVLNARGELVGVISSKLTDPRFEGIGFFASKNSLRFAREFVFPGSEAQLVQQFGSVGSGGSGQTHSASR